MKPHQTNTFSFVEQAAPEIGAPLVFCNALSWTDPTNSDEKIVEYDIQLSNFDLHMYSSKNVGNSHTYIIRKDDYLKSGITYAQVCSVC